MGSRSVAAAAWLIVLAACGGTEFSATNGPEGTGGGMTGSGAGGAQGASGGAGAEVGTAGGGGTGVGGSAVVTVDASAAGGSGGQVSTDGSTRPDVSNGAGGGPALDASPDVGGTAVCPIAEPGAGGVCSGALKCTYGTHPRISCRKTYVCNGGHWVLTPPVLCPDLKACAVENPLPVIGHTCATAGDDCMWDTGLYCRCLACPDVGCPQWNCFPPPDKCGTTPPNLGQACKVDAMPAVCDFGNCSLGNRVTVTCVNGVINWTFPMCP